MRNYLYFQKLRVTVLVVPVLKYSLHSFGYLVQISCEKESYLANLFFSFKFSVVINLLSVQLSPKSLIRQFVS